MRLALFFLAFVVSGCTVTGTVYVEHRHPQTGVQTTAKVEFK